MHTSKQQMHTLKSVDTLTSNEATQPAKVEGNGEKKIYVNMTKEQHEKMYAEFMKKKMAYKKSKMAKRQFQERVGEIRGQYVEPSILEEMKEKTKDDSIQKYYEEILGKEDQQSEKIAVMTIRDVIDLFTSNKMENDIDQLDFTNILPDDTKDTKYCISYFVAFLKNGKTELLPFIVRMNIQDVISYETEVEQMKKDSESDITIWRYFLLEGVEIKPEQKRIHNRSTCEKIKKKMNLIQKASVHVQHDSNDFFFFQYICDSLRFYEKEEEKIKKNIIPQLKKILCESSKASFYWVDTELIYNFYQLYLNMYGSDNVDSIEFMWNCGEKKEIKESCFYIPNMKMMHDEIRKEDFQESEFESISKYSIEDYCFTLNEIFDFKDHFPFKLENSLLYSFGAEMETDNILQMISEYLKFNKMKKEFKEKMVKKGDEKQIKALSSLQKVEINETKNKFSNYKSDNDKSFDLVVDPYLLKIQKKSWYDLGCEAYDAKYSTEKSYMSQIEENMEMFYDLDHNYAPFKKEEVNYNLDAYFYGSNASYEIEQMKNMIYMKKDKSEKEKSIKEMMINVYDRNGHMSILCQMKLPKSIIQMLENHFDVWFGNSFEMIKMKEKSEFERTNHSVNLMTLVYQNFHMKPYMKRENIQEEWKAFERMYLTNVSEKGKEVSSSIRLPIFDYISILKNHFTIDDDVSHRVRSTELNNMFVDVLTTELRKKECELDEEYFITIFSDVVKELGLKKKRYAAGNFYYGIVKKSMEVDTSL